jgi:hypothetical protein
MVRDLMAHRDLHPTLVEGCIGCKVLGLGYDGGHLTRAVTDEHNNTTTYHRSGRQDVLIRAPRVTLSTREDRD